MTIFRDLVKNQTLFVSNLEKMDAYLVKKDAIQKVEDVSKMIQLVKDILVKVELKNAFNVFQGIYSPKKADV